MGSFICAISERDWNVSRVMGIYGNKEGKSDGTYREFDLKTKYSVIRDLVGMKKGDNIFFHVLSKPSRIHGVYICRQPPFFDNKRIWDDPHLTFPYRFLFAPHPDYEHLCSHGTSIDTTDFYELIEQRKIWSLATLENERNIEARSVRKIEDRSETQEIIRILHRDYRSRHLEENIDFTPMSLASNYDELRGHIKDIGRFENSIKALLMYKTGINDSSVIDIFGDISDFTNEVFIAQTTRKAIDILLIQRSATSNKYTICEVKTDRCKSGDLRQLLFYMDLFKRKDLVDIHSDVIMDCLIGKRFDEDVRCFSSRRNAHGINGNILLVQYSPANGGTDATISRIV